MSGGSLSIVLDRLVFKPGETLRGSYQLARVETSHLKAVEITIGWHTEGKGTEARGVEHYEAHPAGDSSLDGDGVGSSRRPTRLPAELRRRPIRVLWASRSGAAFRAGYPEIREGVRARLCPECHHGFLEMKPTGNPFSTRWVWPGRSRSCSPPGSMRRAS